MLPYPLRRTSVLLGLAALALPVAVPLAVPLPVEAQVREVVSKEVSVGSSEATLRLEFRDEGRLEISFDDGSVLVDGEALGAFEPGGDLDAAWRALLGQAVALDDGPLAETLADWTVPAELAGELADLAQKIDEALEEALSEIEVDVQVDGANQAVSISVGDERSLVGALIGSVGRLSVLEEALDGLDSDFRIHIDEDVDIGADETVSGSLVVIEGDVRIAGEVDGDVVLVDGTLELLEGSAVTGDVRLADARLLRNQGSVDGDVTDVLEEERDFEAELTERIRAEVESELRNQSRARDFSLMAPFRPVVRAVGGIFQHLLMVVMLALVGAAILAFGSDKLDTIAETARRAPGRSATVGLAASFLLLPAWILGFIALCVSIIGIPVAIAWLPLFPVAAGLAAVVGYLAVARNAGEWLADSEYPWTGWIRKSNPLLAMVGGLLALMLLFIAGHAVSALPFLGVVTGLLFFVGCLVTFFAVQIGFGAVLLTRGGRRTEYRTYDADEAWEAAMSVDVDVEDVDVEDVKDTKGAKDVKDVKDVKGAKDTTGDDGQTGEAAEGGGEDEEDADDA